MTREEWLEWTRAQLADMAREIYDMGWRPAEITRRGETDEAFGAAHDGYMRTLDRVMDGMMADPRDNDRYDHFAVFRAGLVEFMRKELSP